MLSDTLKVKYLLITIYGKSAVILIIDSNVCPLKIKVSVHVNTTFYYFTAHRLAQLVEHRTAVREVAGSNLGPTNTQGF